MKTKRISTILTVLNLFVSTSLLASDAQAISYRFTILDVPGAASTVPTSINASGQVTGNYGDDSGAHGFLYSNGTFTTLDAPGATATYPTSINASGQVTGSYSDDSYTQGFYGFVYSGGAFTTLDAPGATATFPTSINASGQVTGWYSDDSYHGFVYSGGAFTILDVPGALDTWANSINASGQVTGYYWDAHSYHGFVYGNNTFTTLDVPGFFNTQAININASGQVTGHYYDPFYRFCTHCHGFVYSNGVFTTLDAPGGTTTYPTSTYPTSINANGQVTGSYVVWLRPLQTHSYAFVYSNGVFTTLDVPGVAAGTEATSINASGQVTGHADGHGFIATPICATPTITIHTLTTAPDGGFRITGSITHEGAPLCALVLANGQFMFTCGDPLPKGDFDLTAPLDDQGRITLFGFSSGLAPFQQTLGPSAFPASVDATSCATPKVTYTTAAAPDGRFRITGSITLDGDPLCALVLANGQFLFTCGDPLPKGKFDLTAPLDDQGKITLFGLSAGLTPFQQTFSPATSTPP